MRPAAEYLALPAPTPGAWALALWQAYDPASKVNLHATAVAVAGGGLFFVDPIPLSAAARDELLEEVGTAPAGVLVTNGNHARAAAEFARRFRVPLAATAAAAQAAGVEPAETIPAAGGAVFGETFEAVALPGAVIGEVALCREDGGGLAVIGDALIHLDAYGFIVLPDKYCENPKELRRSLARLAERRFGTLAFAHGDPLVGCGDERLRTLLAG